MSSERWVQRYLAAHLTMLRYARHEPDRAIFRSNETGRWQIYAYDRATGETRQVTDRPGGTVHAELSADGEWIWWFDDQDGNEFGVWRRQAFHGGPDMLAAAGIAAGYPAGIAFARDVAVVGHATAASGSGGGGSVLQRISADGAATLVYSHEHDAHVADVSADGTLIAIAHSEHGDSRHRALRVVRPEGTTLGDLWEGPGLGLGGMWGGPDKGFPGVSFGPLVGDTRLLVRHERRDRGELLIWDPSDGTVREVLLDLPGEVSGRWYPDGGALLVAHAHHARDELYRYDLDTGTTTRLNTPRGVIRGAEVRPDGTVEFAWTSAAAPLSIRSTTGEVVLTAPGPPAPGSVPLQDAWVPGPGGPIHALISLPDDAPRPLPCVFEVHGGPIGYDDDAFDPSVAAWVDQGYAVIQVNYRGSTGYGLEWRNAIEDDPGLTELADIQAVRDWAVAEGLADPRRLVLTGRSWGGYLTLLGIGRQPDDWAVAVSSMPVADYVAAYEDEMVALQAFDRSLFGGSPAEVPDRYRRASPITYVDAVTTPLLVIAGENDPRCPIRQVENYVRRIQERGGEVTFYRYDTGHGSLVMAESIRQKRTALEFVADQFARLDRHDASRGGRGGSGPPGAAPVPASRLAVPVAVHPETTGLDEAVETLAVAARLPQTGGDHDIPPP
ncbi:S9 family peptidase [Micromonospora tulbaghiae]|uniref:S9 family peptidase n=1 Tax=Micromonospora tulbaghiae TaxID=479978 RepID=UPI00343B7FD0